MQPPPKKIYSKRFGGAEKLQKQMEVMQRCADLDDADLFAIFEEQGTEPVIPEHLKGAEEFIRKAKRFSDRFEIDLDITDYTDYVNADFRSSEISLSKDNILLFAELLGMCDDIALEACGSKEFELTLSVGA